MSDLESAPVNAEASVPLQDTTNVSNAAVEVVRKDPQEHGWKVPVSYNYDAYTGTTIDLSTGDATEGERLGAAEIRAEFDADALIPQWAATAARYEWREEYGDVAPAVPELEHMLFKGEYRNRAGAKMNGLEFSVFLKSDVKIDPILKFEDAGLHPVMLENIEHCGYTKPTPIQAYTIPAVTNGHDLIAVAQTGSGKTAAFLIPILSKLMGKAKKLAAKRPDPGMHFDPKINGVTAEPLVLIIVPTRELAVQIFDEVRRLCYRSMLRPCVAYGGGPTRDQLRELARGCDILIGSPGRLIDFMERAKVLSLRRIKYTVIDEADEMVNSDWSEELDKLLSGGDNNEDADHRYLMFSATFPKAAQELAKQYLNKEAIQIKVGRVGSTHGNIYQHVVFASNDRKRDCLRDLLLSVAPVRTIVFVNSKRGADELDDYLYNHKFPSTSIHGDRTQREREDALSAFVQGKAPILITTGVSARGLDVFDVGHVINFDLPKADHGGINEYVHRIGRTARIGHVGVATSFYNEDDEAIAPRLVKLLLETGQAVPDFLEDFIPADRTNLDFDADEDAYGADDAGAAFGADEAATGSVKEDDGW